MQVSIFRQDHHRFREAFMRRGWVPGRVTQITSAVHLKTVSGGLSFAILISTALDDLNTAGLASCIISMEGERMGLGSRTLKKRKGGLVG